MVKVQCDGCSAPYTVSEKRIPAGGLKMRCPKCGTTFLVNRPDEAESAGGPGAPGAGGAAPQRPGGRPGDEANLPSPARTRSPAPRAPTRPGVGPAAPVAKAPAAPGVSAFDDDWDLPEPAGAGLPVVTGAGAGRARGGGAGGKATGAHEPALGRGPQALAKADSDLPLPKVGFGGQAPTDEWDELPVVTGADLPLPKPGSGGGRPGVRTQVGGASPGATMRSLGAPAPPPAKPPIFGRKDTAVGLGGSADDGFGGGGFGEIDIGLPTGGDAAAEAPRRKAATGVEADLPMLQEDNLPARADAGLPAVADIGLPAVADAGLPAVLEGGLPAIATAGLPALAEGGLPAVATGGLPTLAEGGLPAISEGGLPLISEGRLPVISGGNLPTHQTPSSRMAAAYGAGAPASGLAAAATAIGPAPADDFGLSGMPFDDVALEDDFPPSGMESGVETGLELGPAASEASLDGAASSRPAVGDEFELDAAQRRTEQAGADGILPPDGPLAEGGDAPLVQLAPKKSRAFRIAAVAVVALAVGGGALSVTSLGPYGAYAISDFVNRSSHQQALANERAKAQGQLEEDTAAAAKAALEECARAQGRMPRYAPMTAYTAYVAFIKGLRFGVESQDKALGKQLLETLAEANPDPLLTLARAASDGVDGQLARARQAVEGLASTLPNDIGVAVLAAEIALSAKTVEPALQLWNQAVKLKPSARTLFGLARAQLAAEKPDDAVKSAREALKLSPNHAGARTLIASVVWRDAAGEKEAIALLEEVVKSDGPVAKAASSTELAAAHGKLGEIHLARSRMSAAEKAFSAALVLEPESQQSLVGSGELFYRSGRFSEAVARYEAALRVNPDSVDAKIGTAKTWIAQERSKDAKDLMQKLIAAGSKDPLVSYWQGQAEESLGNKDGAAAAYQRAIKDGAGQARAVPAYVAMANLLTSIGKGGEADAVLAEATKLLPESAELSIAKGDVALLAGRLDEAKDEYRHAMQIDPQNLGSKFKLGVALRRGRQFDDATRQFEEVSRIDPEYPGLALEWGLLYEETGQTQLALQMYNEARKKAPNDVDLKLRVGSTLVVSGHAKTAVPLLREVLAARPDSGEANHFLGRALLVVHTNLAEALRLLKRATEIDSNRAEYFLYLGWVANDVGQPAVAEQALKRALELDKNLGDIYWQRGVLAQKGGATLDALEELKIALEKRPSRYEAYATMALCYQDQADWGAAEQAWSKAIEGNGEVAEWHYRLGKILVQRGDRAAATPHIAKAVELAEKEEGAPTPAWLHDAHFLLGEALRGSDRSKALIHYQRFLELAPTDNAYRIDAERAIDTLRRPGEP